MTEAQPTQSGRRKFGLRELCNLLVALLALALLTIYARRFDLSLEAVRTHAALIGPVRSFVFISLLYGLISTAPIPGRDLFKIAAAVIFGWLWSTLAIWIGEMVSALASFWLARIGGRSAVGWILGTRADTIDRMAIKFSPWAVFVARLLPITPYRYFNLACGLTAMPFGNYLVGSIPGTLLRTAFFQYLLVLGGAWLISENVGLGTVFAVGMVLAVLLVGGWGLWMRRRMKRDQA
ncbi:MAG: VTT domain-containing protein [Candidatus Alcyoniella australis]|nr:VTT domain-containing protein [Candidatus Alcyoniella australis]